MGAVALAGVLSGGCGGTAQTRTREAALRGPVDRSQQVRYLDPAGWSLRYPSSFHRESAPSFSELTVASFPLRRPKATHGPYAPLLLPLDPSGHFPKDGVALTLQPLGQGGPGPLITVPDSRFPIPLNTFSLRGLPKSWRAFGLPYPRFRGIEADGVEYGAQVWIGRAARQRLRSELAQMVSSIAFPRLRPGAVVGEGFGVLRRARSYPVGTATRVEVSRGSCDGVKVACARRAGREQVFLVRAPGRGAVPWLVPCRPAGTCVAAGAFYTVGQGAWCPLRFDAKEDQFYCPGNRRWDRVGRQIHAVHSLNLGFAKTAWDGHVIATLDILAPPPPNRTTRLLWPNWRAGS